MPSLKSKLRFTCAFAALATLALAAGSCNGFFVDPTLSSLAIGPSSLSLSSKQTYQMTATGTFNDGSTSNVTSKCVWTSSDPSIATVGMNTGLVTASSTATTIGTTQISASDGATTSTSNATVTVCPAVTSLTISADATSGTPGTAITFTATADVGSQSGVDVSQIVTWTPADTSILTFSGNIGTISSSAAAPSSTTVIATLCNATSSNTITITVTQ